MTLCTFNARRSHFYCGTVRMFCILQGRVARTSLLGHFDVNSIFCHCGWFSAAVRAASAAVALKCCRLASLCFALPRTIATPIARLNCCSMIGLIGYAPPFLSVLMRGEIFIPSSLDAASLQGARRVVWFSQSLCTCPFQNLFCDCSNWNGPTISPVHLQLYLQQIGDQASRTSGCKIVWFL